MARASDWIRVRVAFPTSGPAAWPARATMVSLACARMNPSVVAIGPRGRRGPPATPECWPSSGTAGGRTSERRRAEPGNAGRPQSSAEHIPLGEDADVPELDESRAPGSSGESCRLSLRVSCARKRLPSSRRSSSTYTDRAGGIDVTTTAGRAAPPVASRLLRNGRRAPSLRAGGRRRRRAPGRGGVGGQGIGEVSQPELASPQVATEVVHVAEKIVNERAGGAVVNLVGRADLFDARTDS